MFVNISRLFNLFFRSVDPENGFFLTIDPTYNFHTYPEGRPKFNKSKKSKKKEDNDDDDEDFVRKIKPVSLYMYRDFDRDFYQETIEATLELCEEEVITPYISETFGLHEVNEAIKCIKNKTCTGKILVDVNDTEKATTKKDDGGDENKNTESKKK